MVVTLVNPKVTVMSLDDGLLKLTGKLKTPPSVIVASPIVTLGGVSTIIVTVAVSQFDKFAFSHIV